MVMTWRVAVVSTAPGITSRVTRARSWQDRAQPTTSISTKPSYRKHVMRWGAIFAVPLTIAALTGCGGPDDGARGQAPSRSGPSSSPTSTTSTASHGASPDMHSQFSVAVSTDKEAYTEGEPDLLAVEICNEGRATTTEGGGGSDIPFSYQIVDEQGQVVADDSHTVHTMELRIVRWSEGQCRTAQTSWDQHYWNRSEDRPSEPPEVFGTPQRGHLVPPGVYRIRMDSSQGGATSTPFKLHRRG